MDTVLFRFYAATFAFVMLMAVGFPLVPQHLAVTFAASGALIGLLMGVHGIMQIVLRLPMGDLADRKGRKNSLLATYALTFVAGIFYVLAPNPLWILPAQVLFGLASGIFWVAANAYLFDRVAPEDIPRATSDYSLAIGAAFLVGFPLGGWLADAYGFEAGLSVFLWASVVGLVLVASLPEQRPDPDAVRPPGSVYRRAWRIFQNPDIAISGMGTLLFALLFGTLGAFYPVLLRDVLVFTSLTVGVLLAVRQGMGLVIRVRLPWLLERFGPRNVLIAGVFAAAGTVALVPLPVTLAPHVAIALVAGVAFGVMIPANLTLVSRGSPPDERGLANGIYGTALGIGTAAAAWVMGGVWDLASPAWAFWTASILAALGAVAIVGYARRHPAEPAERAPEVVAEPGGA